MSDDNQRAQQFQAAATSFLALFSIVGLALYGLPLYYDYMVSEFGWSRTQVTSGNALSKLLIGPLFGFLAGAFVDRFGPRRLMLAGILMAGGALIGLGRMSALWMFYGFYLFNALGYVCGGPLPNQVLLSRWFQAGRGKAMGFAYLGIGIGGAVVPWLSYWLTQQWGWRGALQALGVLVIVLAGPMVLFTREAPAPSRSRDGLVQAPLREIFRMPAFYLLAIGSMCSIAAVGGANQHLKLFLSLDQGYQQGEATRIISLVLGCSIAGRLLMGWLADRIPVKHVMLLVYMLVAASIPLLFLGSSPAAMYVFAMMFGIGLGGEYLIIPLMAAELFGVSVLGRVMGIVIAADGVAEAMSPMFVGYLRDASGTPTFPGHSSPVHCEGPMPKPALIVHGGCGTPPPEEESLRLEACERAADAGWDVIAHGGSALDAVETAVRALEEEPLLNAGTGSYLQADGVARMDASLMSGDGRAGAVAQVPGLRNPIRLARYLLEQDAHVMLSGPEALQLALKIGHDPAVVATPSKIQYWADNLDEACRRLDYAAMDAWRPARPPAEPGSATRDGSGTRR
jgi:MFS family permease